MPLQFLLMLLTQFLVLLVMVLVFIGEAFCIYFILMLSGHCPHDEVPELVNEGLLGFIRTSVLHDKQALSQGAHVDAMTESTVSSSPTGCSEAK